MTNDPVRLLTLILGYDVNASPPPKWAALAGLHKRFAVALDPIRSDEIETDFDVELFLNLTSAILELVPHDAMAIELWDGSHCSSLAELAEIYAATSEKELEPPDAIRLERNNRLVCAVQIWPSAMTIDSPHPYTGTYAIIFYTQYDQAEEFRHACEQVCRDLGAQITECFVGAVEMPFRVRLESYISKESQQLALWSAAGIGLLLLLKFMGIL